MPAKSRAQQRFMGAELGRLRRGEKTRTGMSERQLEEYARTPRRRRLPERVGRGQDRCPHGTTGACPKCKRAGRK